MLWSKYTCEGRGLLRGKFPSQREEEGCEIAVPSSLPPSLLFLVPPPFLQKLLIIELFPRTPSGPLSFPLPIAQTVSGTRAAQRRGRRDQSEPVAILSPPPQTTPFLPRHRQSDPEPGQDLDVGGRNNEGLLKLGGEESSAKLQQSSGVLFLMNQSGFQC